MTNDQLINPGFGEWVTLSDGYTVFSRTWSVPESTPLVATLTWVHGIGEHVTRYDHVFQQYAAAGIATTAHDQRGFGRTAAKHGKRGNNGGWNKVMSDIREIIERSSVDGVPRFLGGQSMGGMIALDFHLKYGAELGLAGVLITSPAISTWPSARPPAPVISFLKQVVKLAPNFAISNPVPAAQLTSDAELVHLIETDPLMHAKMTLALGDAFLTKVGPHLDSEEGAQAAPAHIPLLLTHGELDRVTYPPATKTYAERATQVQDLTLVTYPDGLHELHNEPHIKDEVVREYIKWILARVAGPVPGRRLGTSWTEKAAPRALEVEEGVAGQEAIPEIAVEVAVVAAV